MWFIIVIAIIVGTGAGLFDNDWLPAEAFLLLTLLCYQLLKRKHVVFSALILSYLISSLHLAYRFDDSLPLYLSGQVLKLTGEIVEILPSQAPLQRFSLQVQHCETLTLGQKCHFQGRVKLSWYQKNNTATPLSQDQSWQFKVRVLAIHGFINQGQRRYRLLQLAQGYDATGYVRNDEAQLLTEASGLAPWQTEWRSTLNHRLQQLAPQMETQALLQPLILGKSQAIQAEQWRLLQGTGTVHLVVISGLHLALLLLIAWRLTGVLTRLLPLDHWRWYQWVSLIPLLLLLPLLWVWPLGVAIQRALLMLFLLMSGRLLAFYPSPWRLFTLALTTLLLTNPFWLLQAGLYYSFGAVLLLLLQAGAAASFWRLVPLQLTLFIGLIGLQSFWLNAPDLSSILANLVAIPLISLLFLPLSLLALILPLSAGTVLSQVVLAPLAQLFWQWLQLCQNLHLPLLTLEGLAGGALFATAIVLAIPKLPYKAPWVIMGLVISLATFAQKQTLSRLTPSVLSHGQFKAEILDVGQGLAVFVTTQHHQLLYDTGPKFSSGFTPIELALLPRLQQSLSLLDQLIISHSDNDHAGAIDQLKGYYPEPFLTGQPDRFAQASGCYDGLQWQWDAVHFELLHPPKHSDQLHLKDDNQHSCVLKIQSLTHPEQSLLLTGDIDQSIEQRLIRQHPEKLKARWLVASHHGSATGNHLLFLKQVQPEGILYSAGYHNRFGHPSPLVQANSQYLGIQQYSTAEMGALSLTPNADGSLKLTTEVSQLPNRWLWQP